MKGTSERRELRGVLVIRDEAAGFGSVGSVLRDVGKGALSAVKTTATGAVQGAGQTLGQKLRDLISPSSTGGGGRGPPPTSYLPWVLGGAAVLGVGYMVLGRR